MKRNIAFVSIWDAKNVKSWSGTTSYMYKALCDVGFNVYSIDNLNIKNYYLHKAKKIIIKTFSPYKYNYFLNSQINEYFAKQIAKSLRPNTDMIFSPAGTMYATSLVKTSIPRISYGDAPLVGMFNFYDEFTNLIKSNLTYARIIEKEAMQKTDLIIYSSDWAIDIAKRHYDVPHNKFKMIPLGANIDENRSSNDICNLLYKKSKDTCDILFVGVDWKRKGADIAVAITENIIANGIPARLHVVGIKSVPKDHKNKPYLINHGFISKSTQSGRDKLYTLFSTSHFLLVPSIAEAYGLVFCEASSFGLPSIASNVGGIPTIIKPNRNGMTFSLNSDISLWSNYIIEHYLDKTKYKELSLNSFDEYKFRLNWNTIGKHLKDSIIELL